MQLQQAAVAAAAAAAAAAATITEGADTSGCTDGNDSAFEDWETSCSRTTPINHKSIRKWRQQSQPGGEAPGSIRACTTPLSSSNHHRKSTLATPPGSVSSFSPISIMTSSPLDTSNGGPLSAPSGLHSWQPNRPGYSPNDSLFTSPASTSGSSEYSMHVKKRLKSETVTSPDSVSSIEDSKTNIPVGIAVARQRTATMTSSTSEGENNKSSLSSDDSGIEMKRPVPPPPPPPRPPTAASNDTFLESWLRQPHLWPALSAYPPAPIGGYQFVKDPLTGQMFFVPGFASTPATPPLWSPTAHPPSYGLTPFQQSLMQLQQESLLVRQAGLFFNQQQQQQSSSSRPLSPLRPSAPPPPTIESPDIKINGGHGGGGGGACSSGSAIATTDNDTEDNLSVGDVNDELKPSVPVQPEADEAEVPAASPVNSDVTIATAPIKVKQEAADKNDARGCNDVVLQPIKPSGAVGLDKNGLHLLTEGIDRLEHHRLKPPPAPLPGPPPHHRPSRLGLLCDAAFLSDDEAYLRSTESIKDVKLRSRSLDSPIKKVKGERTLSSDYRSPKAERNAKAFIASKSLRVSDELGHVSSSLQPKLASSSTSTASSTTTTSGSSSISNHKNSGGGGGNNKMPVWEEKMRLDLADIQKKYKEKYKELYKLQHKTSSAKKANLSPQSSAGGSSMKGHQQRPPTTTVAAKKTLAPISPWLQTFKMKMNGHHSSSGDRNKTVAMEKHQVSAPHKEQRLLQPDLISTDKSALPSHNQIVNGKTTTTSNGAMSPGPDLSTITSKFRSARPNPFENLLKLSCVGKKSNDGVKKTEEEDDCELVIPPNPANAKHAEAEPIQTDPNETFPLATSTPKVVVVNNKKHGLKKKGQKEAFLLQDDLKPLPKLHLASNNNIDDHGDADVSDEEDDPCSSSSRSSPPVLEPMTTLMKTEPKNNITVKIKRHSSPTATAEAETSATTTTTTEMSPKPPKKSKKEKKAKKAKRERHREHHHHHHHHKKHHKKPIVHVNDDSEAPADCIDLTKKTGSSSSQHTDEGHQLGLKPVSESQMFTSSGSPPSLKQRLPVPCAGPQLCVIKETDLVDGLRVLVKLEGHFHPGKIQAISPPDIYGVLVDKERGNKPHIFSREEVLREAVSF